jgi:nicotinamide-nucleotide amidase
MRSAAPQALSQGIFGDLPTIRTLHTVLSSASEEQALHDAGAEIGRLLLARRMKLAAAESCTGGWLSKVVTEVAGCSDWFDCSFVAYSYEAKESMLGVSRVTLEMHGAVSEEVVVEMVRGALSRSRANVAVAITGIAGPSGGTPGKPVGTVWLAWGRGHHPPITQVVHLQGDRDAVRRQTVAVALAGLQKILTTPSEAF